VELLPAVMAYTGAILCVPVPYSSGLVKSKDAVKCTVVHTETKLWSCTSLALCTATVGVSYCLLELKMTLMHDGVPEQKDAASATPSTHEFGQCSGHS
jgi:hypothetical protein